MYFLTLQGELRMLKNPIFKKEFSLISRSIQNNIIICSYLIFLSITIVALWPSEGVLSLASAAGKQIFSIFFSINLTLILLMVPAFSASSITYEKENNTFSSLFVTLLSPFEIMSGKLFASIICLLLVVLFSTPIAAICSLTGGISNLLLFKILFVLFLSAFSYAMVGLAASAVCERTSTAVVLNYAIIASFAGGSWLPSALLSNLLQHFQWLFHLIRSFSPYDVIFYLLYPEAYSLTSRVMTTNFFNPFTVFTCFSIFLSIVSFMIFERCIFRPSAKTKAGVNEQYTDFKKLVKRKLSWPFYLIDPLKRKKNISSFSNPVFVVELRSRIFGNPKFIIRTISAIFILSLIIMTLVALQYGNMVRPESVRLAAIVFQLGVIALIAPGLSSGLITDEIASGTFVMLRMTPLSPITVVLGKLKATFFYAMIFLISSFFVLFAMAFLEQQNLFPETSILSGMWWSETISRAKNAEWWSEFWNTYRRIFLWVILLLLSALTFLSTGLFCSAFSRKTSTATATAYVITAIICVLSFAPLILRNKLSHELSMKILSLNPVASALQITNSTFSDYPGLWIKNIYTLVTLVIFFTLISTFRTWLLFRKQE